MEDFTQNVRHIQIHKFRDSNLSRKSYKTERSNKCLWAVCTSMCDVNHPELTKMLDQTAALNGWAAVNDAELVVISDPKPVSSALPNSLRMKIPTDTAGPVGFSNAGFWGER